jgi:oligoribonuclease NrnB/cAMP/cGMP phosphodiesterase (DHH superfamily)
MNYRKLVLENELETLEECKKLKEAGKEKYKKLDLELLNETIKNIKGELLFENEIEKKENDTWEREETTFENYSSKYIKKELKAMKAELKYERERKRLLNQKIISNGYLLKTIR